MGTQRQGADDASQARDDTAVAAGVWQRWDLERVAELGPVMPGWRRDLWVSRLRYLADACRKVRPDLAVLYERWAERCEKATRTA